MGNRPDEVHLDGLCCEERDFEHKQNVAMLSIGIISKFRKIPTKVCLPRGKSWERNSRTNESMNVILLFAYTSATRLISTVRKLSRLGTNAIFSAQGMKTFEFGNVIKHLSGGVVIYVALVYGNAIGEVSVSGITSKVLSTVNAPYGARISASTLASSISDLNEMPKASGQVFSFFTEIDPALQVLFVKEMSLSLAKVSKVAKFIASKVPYTIALAV